MASNINKTNKSTELNFLAALEKANISEYTTHENFPGKPDILLSQYKIVIFLDGCFWHYCPQCGHIPNSNKKYWETKFQRTKERDEKVNSLLETQGFKVIRFWEHELIENIDDCAKYVLDIIDHQIFTDSLADENMIYE
jgi:DNA mismatch endonuclease (patch repair protein)